MQVYLPLLGELRHHRPGDALRNRRPAEYRFRSDGIARSGLCFAIALEEGDPAVLDDADGEADDGALLAQLLKAAVDGGIIDVLTSRRR